MSEKRLIDANALLEKLDALSEIFRRRGESEDKGFLAVQCGVTYAICEVDEAPSVPAEVVRHGRWVYDNGVSTCSDCGGEQMYNGWDELEFTPWCHNCGARMDEHGEGDSNED